MPIITNEDFERAIHDAQQSAIRIERDNFREIVNGLRLKNHIPLPDDLYQKMRDNKNFMQLGFDILMQTVVNYLHDRIDSLPELEEPSSGPL